MKSPLKVKNMQNYFLFEYLQRSKLMSRGAEMVEGLGGMESESLLHRSCLSSQHTAYVACVRSIFWWQINTNYRALLPVFILGLI